MFKLNQLVVLTTSISSCGCSRLPAKAILQIKSKKGDQSSEYALEEDEYETKSCKNGCVTVVSEEHLRPLKAGVERLTAKEKFEKATEYNYASVN